MTACVFVKVAAGVIVNTGAVVSTNIAVAVTLVPLERLLDVSLTFTLNV